MSAILCALLATAVPEICPPQAAAPAINGWLSLYDQAPTVATIAYRQLVGDLPQDLRYYDGFIAVCDCGRIGDLAWLSIADGPWLRVAAMDCAANDGTPEWMTANNIIAELDYFTAQQFGISGGEPAALVWVNNGPGG